MSQYIHCGLHFLGRLAVAVLLCDNHHADDFIDWYLVIVRSKETSNISELHLRAVDASALARRQNEVVLGTRTLSSELVQCHRKLTPESVSNKDGSLHCCIFQQILRHK